MKSFSSDVTLYNEHTTVPCSWEYLEIPTCGISVFIYHGDVWKACQGPTLRQCLGIIVWMLWQPFSPTLGTDVETTFSQHCVNFVSKLVPNFVLGCFRSRMTVTFKFENFTHLQHQYASQHWHNHIYKYLWVILPTMTVELMGRWWIFKKVSK